MHACMYVRLHAHAHAHVSMFAHIQHYECMCTNVSGVICIGVVKVLMFALMYCAHNIPDT